MGEKMSRSEMAVINGEKGENVWSQMGDLVFKPSITIYLSKCKQVTCI